MSHFKMYPTVLAVLFFTVLVACAAPPAIEPPAFSRRPASFEVGPITLSPPVVMVGDSVTVSTTFKNTDAIAGTYTVALLVNGQQSGSQDISLNPESSQEVTFQLSETTAGDYYLSIGSSNAVLTVYNWSPYTIQYDESDGAPVCIYVSGENGHIVRFTPPSKAFIIRTIKILGTVSILNTSEFDQNHVTVRIWDKEGNNQLWSQDFPWRLFMGPAIWREIEVPEVRVNDDFYVEVVTHSNPAGYRSDGTIAYGGDPIDFVQLSISGMLPGVIKRPLSVVVIGFDYPQSYIDSPANRPETRSGYSYMGKLIDPGQKRLEGIQWLIRVEGEGAPGS